MDDAVGNVMQTLRDEGLLENTVVIFTSDNGGVSAGDANCTSNLPLRGGKGRQWEGGLRVPLFIYSPGQATTNSITDQPATHADLFPTIMDLTGIAKQPTQKVEGISLTPLLHGQSIPNRPLYWHYPHYGNQGGEPSSIWQEDNWKLIHYYEDGRNELYDLSADPGETNDVTSLHRERTKSMYAKLDQKLNEYTANRPVPDNRFDPEKAAQTARSIREKRLPQLEKEQARLLDKDFRPNPTWWDSAGAK